MVVDTLSQFSSWIDRSELRLPAGTLVFEEEGKVRGSGLEEYFKCAYTHVIIFFRNVFFSYISRLKCEH